MSGLWLALLGGALAGPTLDVHVQAGAGNTDAQRGGSLGVAVGLPLTPRLAVEGLFQGGLSAELAPRLSLRPELRLRLTPPDPERGGLSLLAGYGVGLRPSPLPEGAFGLALDLPPGERVGVRVQGRYVLDGLSPSSFQLALGGVWTRAEAAPEPEPVVEAEPLPVLEVNPPEAMAWLPHPYCAWLPVSEVARLLPSLDPALQLQIVAQGYLPAQLTAGAPAQLTLESAPRQGSVIVVARPGDVLQVDGRPVVVGADGVAVVSAREGLVQVEVRGGGRRLEQELAIGTGLALWVRVPDPVAAEVRFALGSSAVVEAERARIAEIARLAEGWRFEVQGSASPEGDAASNLVLADERARAVAALLIDAGLPTDRVTFLPAVVAPQVAEGQDPAALRVATIRALPARGSP